MSKAKPILCDRIQPWKNNSDPTSKPSQEVEEALMQDLVGTTVKLWEKYRRPGYTLEDAASDAYVAFKKAVEKDRSAPKITKRVSCPSCNCNFMPHCPGDERADHIYNIAPSDRVPTKRIITVKCPDCSHSWSVTKYKTKFSTHVFSFIRGQIQSGVKRSSIKNSLSMDADMGDYTMHDMIGQTPDQKESIPVELQLEIHSIISGMTDRHKETAALFYGIGGNNLCQRTVERQITCHNCGNKSTAEIDYSYSANFHACPECGIEISVNMSMNQTDIAEQFGISKQRIGNIIKTINERLFQKLGPLIDKHGLSF